MLDRAPLDYCKLLLLLINEDADWKLLEFVHEQISRHKLYFEKSLLGGVSSGMGLDEHLRRNLPKMDNLSLTTFLVHLILFTLQIIVLLISQVVVKIQGFFSLLTSLFVPENKVNPVRQVF